MTLWPSLWWWSVASCRLVSLPPAGLPAAVPLSAVHRLWLSSSCHLSSWCPSFSAYWLSSPSSVALLSLSRWFVVFLLSALHTLMGKDPLILVPRPASRYWSLSLSLDLVLAHCLPQDQWILAIASPVGLQHLTCSSKIFCKNYHYKLQIKQMKFEKWADLAGVTGRLNGWFQAVRTEGCSALCIQACKCAKSIWTFSAMFLLCRNFLGPIVVNHLATEHKRQHVQNVNKWFPTHFLSPAFTTAVSVYLHTHSIHSSSSTTKSVPAALKSKSPPSAAFGDDF